jgi:glycerol uptake facilitator-like aquaporin
MIRSLKTHWQEYLIEAFGLGAFMVAAGTVVTAIEIDASPIKHYIADPFFRRIPIGVAMGLTAIALIYSPWGKRSGAHLNPAVTLTFFRVMPPKSTALNVPKYFGTRTSPILGDFEFSPQFWGVRGAKNTANRLEF